jgi:Killing trait
MAFPTAVNSQITDSVSQTNVKVLAESPAMAMGSLYQASALALGLAAQNAANAQQQAYVAAQAATTAGVAVLFDLANGGPTVVTEDSGGAASGQ